jgi:hypothetical protein
MPPMADSAKLRIWLNPFGDETSSEKRPAMSVYGLLPIASPHCFGAPCRLHTYIRSLTTASLDAGP